MYHRLPVLLQSIIIDFQTPPPAKRRSSTLFSPKRFGSFTFLSRHPNASRTEAWRILYKRTPAFLKWSEEIKQPKIYHELCNEVQIYNHLDSLQGVVIPRMLYSGLISNFIYGLVLEEIRSPLTLNNLPASLSPSDKEQLFVKIISAISAIHQFGVLHQDIREENILIVLNPQSLSTTSSPPQQKQHNIFIVDLVSLKLSILLLLGSFRNKKNSRNYLLITYYELFWIEQNRYLIKYKFYVYECNSLLRYLYWLESAFFFSQTPQISPQRFHPDYRLGLHSVVQLSF